jgi:hypothetical protein
MPADLRCPPDPGGLPLLPVPRAHRPAARRPGPPLHGTLHPCRAAGRAGLGRPVCPGDRSGPGRPRARPGARRRLATPGTPRQAGRQPSARPWASWTASSSGCSTPTWPRSSP